MDKQEGPEAAAVRLGEPWYDALADGWGDLDGTGPPGMSAAGISVPGARTPDTGTPAMAGAPGRAEEPAVEHTAADIYLEVQRSAAFQEVRGRYRGFVVPASIAFLVWYFAYVLAATVTPSLMARPVVGAVNVAMVAGLGQFLTTFVLTWAYVRHARLNRDGAALELRWDTQELTRGRQR